MFVLVVECAHTLDDVNITPFVQSTCAISVHLASRSHGGHNCCKAISHWSSKPTQSTI